MFKRIIVGGLALLSLVGIAAESARHGVGRPATAADIAKHRGLVGPTGIGLPKGRGTAAQGRALFAERCASCHGLKGEGANGFPALVGGLGTLGSGEPKLTVGSYWPFATTVWDYINRAMPYQSAGTLTPDEVYAVTAYVLAMNGIIPESLELNEQTLPTVKMPNRNGFVSDPRPDVK